MYEDDIAPVLVKTCVLCSDGDNSSSYISLCMIPIKGVPILFKIGVLCPDGDNSPSYYCYSH